MVESRDVPLLLVISSKHIYIYIRWGGGIQGKRINLAFCGKIVIACS